MVKEGSRAVILWPAKTEIHGARNDRGKGFHFLQIQKFCGRHIWKPPYQGPSDQPLELRLYSLQLASGLR